MKVKDIINYYRKKLDQNHENIRILRKMSNDLMPLIDGETKSALIYKIENLIDVFDEECDFLYDEWSFYQEGLDLGYFNENDEL